MSQSTKRYSMALGLASALWMLSLAGCSSSTPTPESAALKHAELTFDINKCQQLGAAGLYQCPATDKPVCNPDYTGTDVQCVRINKNGTILVQQMQME